MKLRIIVVVSLIAAVLPAAGCVPLTIADNNRFFANASSESVELILLRKLDTASFKSRDDRLGTLTGSGPGHVSGVAARGNDLWLIDQSAMLLLHVDLLLLESQAVATIRHPGSQGLFATENHDVFVVDRSANSIKQFDRMGSLVREFFDRNLLTAPVDVAVLNFGSSIVVADAMENQLLVFSRLGDVVRVLGSHRSSVPITQSVSAIAAAGRELVVVDPLMNDVARIDLAGNRTENLGEDEVRFPVAVAADRCGRVYVADGENTGLLVIYPDVLRNPSRVDISKDNIIAVTDLWTDDDRLYVAAGAQGITIYAVTPVCPGA